MRLPIRSFAAALLSVGVATCSDIPQASLKPSPDGGRIGQFNLAPVFSPSAQAVYARRATFAAANFDRVRIRLVRPPDEVVKDTTVVFTPTSPTLTLVLTVPVKTVGEVFNATVEYTNSGVPVYRGEAPLVSHSPDAPSPPQQSVVVTYVGPGASATRVVVSPKTVNLVAPGGTTLTANAFDANNNAVAGVPLAWRTSDATVAAVNSTTGAVTTFAKRGTATITVELPTGVSDNATVTVTLPPTGMTLVSGGGQTGKAGATLGQPAVVRVVASDGLGVAGVTVNFAAPANGSVGSSSVTTNADGQASTSLTLGGALGPQSFAASALGFNVSIGATATVGDPALMAVVSGSGQQDTVRRALRAPFVVRVTDRFGNPVSGVSVSWSRTAGSGQLGAATSVTGADGQAAMGYTLGSTPGAETVTAAVSGVQGSATFSATAVPAGPAAIAIVSGANQTGRVLQPLAAPFVVRVTDVDGNPVVGAPVNWSATNGSIAAGTATDAQGQSSATFTLGSAVGPASATATIGTGATAKSVTFTATVQAGIVAKLVFKVQPSTAAAGAAIAPAVRIELQDAAGNLTAAANSVTIALGANPGEASLSGTLTRTSSGGVATFDDLRVSGPGTGYTLVASSGGVPSVTSAAFNITNATAGPPARLLIVTQPSANATSFVPLSQQPAIQVVDANNNPVPTPTPIQIEAVWSTGSERNSAAQTNASGLATFTNLAVVGAGTGPIRFSIPNQETISPVNSNPVTSVVPPQPTALQFAVQPSNVSQSAAIAPPVQVRIVDAQGALVSTATNSVTIAIGDNPGESGLSGTTTVAAVNGVATFSNLSINNAATGYTLTASSANLTGATSNTFNVLPPQGNALQFLVQPSNTTVNAAIAPAVQVRIVDAQGALVPSATNSVTIAFSNNPGESQLSGTTTVAAVNGVATFSNLAINNPGSGYRLTASGANLTGTTSNSFDVLQQPIALQFQVHPSPATQNVAISPAVQVRIVDAQGAIVTTATSAVTIAIGTNPANGTLAGTATVAPVNGVATFSNLSINNAGTGYRLAASAANLTGATSNTFDVLPASAAVVWSNASGGAWNNPANWSPARVPLATDDVVIGLSGTYTVTLNVNAAVQSVTVGGASGAQTLSIPGTTLTVSSALAVLTNGIVAANNGWIDGAGAVANQGLITLHGSTIASALANQGTIVSNATSNISGALSTLPGSMIRAQADGSTGFSNFMVLNSFTNNGAIELTSIGSTYNATITVTNGTLTNAAGGTITAVAGSGGTRQIEAQLVNLGLVTVNQAMTTSRSAAQHQNSGTINLAGGNWTLNQSGVGQSFTNTGTVTIGAGRTWQINSGTLNHNGGSIDGGAGTLSLTSVTANFASSFTNATTALALSSTTVNGPGTITIAATKTLTMLNGTIAAPLDNQGTIVSNGTGAINGTYANSSGSIVRAQPDGSTGFSNLTFANGFTNNGTIELTSAGSTYSANIAVTSGTLTNALGATIASVVGTGGARTLTAQLDNQGTVTINQPLTINRGSSAHTNSGTINAAASLTVNQSGTSPSFTNTGTVTIAASQTWLITSGVLNQNAGSIGGTGTLSLSSVTANFATNFTNANTALVLSNSTVNGSGTITNAATKTLSMLNSTIAAPLDNQGTIISNGTGAINGTFTMSATSTVRLQPDGTTGFSNLTFANGFTNVGAIELTSVGSAYSSTLTVTAGTLTNASGGTITSVVGAGGARTLTAQLDNQGTVTVNQPLTMNRGSSAHTNSGTINAVAGLTLNQSGTSPSFTNTGTVTIAASQTWLITSGTLNQNGGSIGGAGTLNLASVTANFATNFTNANTALVLSSSTVNGPGSLTNAATKTLTLLNTTVNAALDNQGTIIVNGTNVGNGAYTMSATSMLRFQADGSTGFAGMTFLNGFTNIGAIEFTTLVSAYSTGMTVTNGTLTNASGGTITSVVGAGGPRTLTAQLDNQGLMTINQPLTMNRGSSAHTNSGTINAAANFTLNQSGTSPSFTNTGTVTIAPSQTWAITSGVLNQSAGSIGGAGTLNLGSVTANFTTNFTNANTALVVSSSILNGPGSLTNAATKTLTLFNTTVNAPLDNQGTIVVNGTSAVNGTYSMSSTSMLRLQADGSTGFAGLTFPNGVTNTGAIEFTTLVSAYTTQLTVTNGTLTNASGGTITSLAGTGGTRIVSAQLHNQGTVTVNHALTMNQGSVDHVNDGAFNLVGGDVTLNQSGTTPTFTNNGTLSIGAGRTFTISSGGFTQAATATLNGGGSLSLNSTTATFNSAFTLGALSLSNSTIGISAGISTAATNLTVSNSSTINGPGLITNPQGSTFNLTSSTIGATSGLTNGGQLNVNGNSAINGPLTTSGTSVIRMRADGSTGFAGLTVANSFTNNGAIELTTLVSAYTANLTVTSGTFTNALGASFVSEVGTGGSRTLAAQLDNKGTIVVNHPLTITLVNADHVNSGQLNITTGDLTLSQSGTTPTFTNSGAIAMNAGRSFTINSGTFTQPAAGSIDGGALVPTSATVALDGTVNLAAITATNSTLNLSGSYATATTALSLSSTTVNGPCAITNSTGQTVSMLNSTIASTCSFANQGTLVSNGTSFINGAFTTTAASILRLEPNGSTGNSNLTIASANGFTNSGAIQLTSQTSAYPSTLTVSGGALANAGTITSFVGTGGTRQINGVVNNTGTINIASGGTGRLTISGSLANAGTLNFKIGGTGQGTTYDQLQIIGSPGTATFGVVSASGTLNASLVNGFTPAAGAQFGVITYSSANGSIANLVLPAAGWLSAVGGTAVTLTAPAP